MGRTSCKVRASGRAGYARLPHNRPPGLIGQHLCSRDGLVSDGSQNSRHNPALEPDIGNCQSEDITAKHFAFCVRYPLLFGSVAIVLQKQEVRAGCNCDRYIAGFFRKSEWCGRCGFHWRKHQSDGADCQQESCYSVPHEHITIPPNAFPRRLIAQVHHSDSKG